MLTFSFKLQLGHNILPRRCYCDDNLRELSTKTVHIYLHPSVHATLFQR